MNEYIRDRITLPLPPKTPSHHSLCGGWTTNWVRWMMIGPRYKRTSTFYVILKQHLDFVVAVQSSDLIKINENAFWKMKSQNATGWCHGWHQDTSVWARVCGGLCWLVAAIWTVITAITRILPQRSEIDLRVASGAAAAGPATQHHQHHLQQHQQHQQWPALVTCVQIF